MVGKELRSIPTLTRFRHLAVSLSLHQEDQFDGVFFHLLQVLQHGVHLNHTGLIDVGLF